MPRQEVQPLSLGFHLIARFQQDRGVACRLGTRLDGLRQLREEGVGDVRDDEAENTGPSGAQGAGGAVHAVTDGRDGPLHPLNHLWRNLLLAVEHV